MRRSLYILRLYVAFLILTIAGKIAFMAYNRQLCFFDISDTLTVLLRGLPMDLVTVSYMVAVPWVITALTLLWRRMPLRFVLLPWFLIISVVVAATTAGTIIMYQHWGFVLDASIFSYMSSPGNASSSASGWYIFTRLSSAILSIVVVFVVSILVTPSGFAARRRRSHNRSGKARWFLWIEGAVLALIMSAAALPVLQRSTFYSSNLFLCHAATNPVFRMGHSAYVYSRPYDEQFQNLASGTEDASDMYPIDTQDIQDTLLTTQRPNVITIQLESYGASFIRVLGGARRVSPNLCRWMKKGVNFTNAWSSSFRTDRGTVSALSGYVSYPTESLMLKNSCLDKLPSLAHSLKKQGYQTDYLYGGHAEFMNKEKYLLAIGFEKVWDVDDIDVPEEERDCWGANDSISLNRMMSMIMERHQQGKPFYFGYQTISSHEPFVVPYSRLDNPILNAFAYSDHCVGMFLDSLSRTPAWDNTLVVIFADHGYLYNLTYQDPEFFHMPLLMVGGAVRGARSIDTLINQSDIVATVLSQMGIDHSDFPWSRNIFSKNYTDHFVYCSYPAGLLYADSTGVTMTDIYANVAVCNTPDTSEYRLHRMNAILKKTYQSIP